MSELVLAEGLMEHLRKRYPCYHDTAYLFVLSGLHYTIDRLGEARHITGRELTEGCRDLALERYGPMARSVLEFWGIRSTRDLGELVFALVECGVLVKQETDDLDDFDGIFDFVEAFEHQYPWSAPREMRG